MHPLSLFCIIWCLRNSGQFFSQNKNYLFKYEDGGTLQQVVGRLAGRGDKADHVRGQEGRGQHTILQGETVLKNAELAR